MKDYEVTFTRTVKIYAENSHKAEEIAFCLLTDELEALDVSDIFEYTTKESE
jgi:hypothetical protein